MRLTCNLHNIFNNLSQKQGIKDIVEAGFDKAVLDVNAVCDPKEFINLGINNYERESKRVYLTEQPLKLISEVQKKILGNAKGMKLEFPIAMAPSISPATIQKKKLDPAKINETYRILAAETLRLAIANNCEAVIIPPIFLGISPKDEWNINKSFYKELDESASEQKSDVQILLLNMCKDINGHLVRGVCAEPDEAVNWVDELNEECRQERFGFCYDIGAGTLSGMDLMEAIAPISHRLKAVIVRDCDGVHDAAMLPFTACFKSQQTDWPSMVKGIMRAGFDGFFIMDVGDSYLNMPSMYRGDVLKMSHKLGNYFMWHINMPKTVRKYDKRVLFGAGNMCRNYLLNYGKECPPLFTCDNNSSRWGETFDGLTIEPPDKLKELSPDTAIFICNSYYREITDQLKNEMKLPNPIEYFSDEYSIVMSQERLTWASDPNASKEVTK